MNIRSFRKVDVAIIGGGVGDLSAAQEVSSYTDNYLLIGTDLLSALPPRVFVDWAKEWHQHRRLASSGALRGPRNVEQGRVARKRPAEEDLQQLREQYADALQSGSFDTSPDKFLDGEARLVGPNHIYVAGRIVEADAIVVAMGNPAIVPQKWQTFADGILSTEQLLAAQSLPDSLAVIGLGPEGLALAQAQALQRLGVEVSGFDTNPNLAGIRDPDIAAEALAVFDREFPIVLGRAIDVQRADEGFRVSAGAETAVVDRLLVTQVSRSNAAGLGWEKIGVPTDEQGVPLFDAATLRIPGTSVFIVGEAVVAHHSPQSLVLQGRIAGYNAVRRSLRQIPEITPLSIVFSDPNIAAVGEPLSRLDADRTVTVKLRHCAAALGSLSELGEGMLKLYADREDGRLLGGAMIGPGYEHVAHLLAVFVHQRLSVRQALDMPVSHPVVEEALHAGLSALQRALECRSPLCEDLPVVRPNQRLGISLMAT